MRAALLQVALRGLSTRFWIVGAATVTVCAALAARAAGQVVEARYLTDAPHAPTLPRVEQQASPAPVPLASHASSSLVERNMFCSDCGGAGDPEPTGSVAHSTLPLELIATSLGVEPWATVRNTATGAQGAFGVGDRIPTAGAVTHVAGTWIEVMNEASGQAERIDLLAVAGAAAPKAATATTQVTPENPYADRVKAIDDHTFEVDRQLVRDLVSGGRAEGVLIRPQTKGDQLLGIKVVMAKPTSVAAAIGLKSGDLIEGIDGAKIESAQQLIDMLARLDDISTVKLDGKRKGAAMSDRAPPLRADSAGAQAFLHDRPQRASRRTASRSAGSGRSSRNVARPRGERAAGQEHDRVAACSGRVSTSSAWSSMPVICGIIRSHRITSKRCAVARAVAARRWRAVSGDDLVLVPRIRLASPGTTDGSSSIDQHAAAARRRRRRRRRIGSVISRCIGAGGSATRNVLPLPDLALERDRRRRAR